jgi:hypothetical protein
MARDAQIIGLLACVWLLGGCGAGRQDEPARHVFESHNLLRHAGYVGPGPISSGEIGSGEERTLRTVLGSNRCYLVAAFGSPGIADLSLTVAAPDGEQVARENSTGRNAVVSFCAERDGEHQVTLAATGGAGSYDLTYWVATEGGSGGEQGGGTRLALGRPVQGVLPPGQRFVDYSLNIRQRRAVVIDLESADFDAFLYLIRDGIELTRDDDGGEGLNSRITTVLEPGAYTVRVGSFADSGAGQFSLVVR